MRVSLIEVKLSSNDQYLHGYEVQLMEYGKAEQTDNLIYGLIDLGHPRKIDKIRECYNKHLQAGEKYPDLIVIDGIKKESASRA